MLILGIDTSKTNHINISLAEDDKIIQTIEKETKKTEETINLVYDLFKDLAINPQSLQAIGVITGPGGYTGIRAGVAVAKTMSQLLEIPCVGFNKADLYILSYPSESLLCPLVDVKRNEVYTCFAQKIINSTLSDLPVINYQINHKVIEINELLEELENFDGETIVLANELDDKKEIFNNLINSKISFNYDFKINSKNVCNLTYKSILNGYDKGYDNIIPIYAREAV